MSEPILDYAILVSGPDIPFLAATLRWRWAAVWSLVVFVLGITIVPQIGVLGLIGAVVSSVMALIYMTRAAAREVSGGYALRHLLLALALMPLFFFGVLIVPLMVQSDTTKWREAAAG